jgi:hypothetical protein
MAPATFPAQAAAAPGVYQACPSHTRPARTARAGELTSMLPSAGTRSQMRSRAAVTAATRWGRPARCSPRPGDMHPVNPATAWIVHASRISSSTSSSRAADSSSRTSRASTVSRAASLVQKPEPRYPVKLVPASKRYDRNHPIRCPARPRRLRCSPAHTHRSGRRDTVVRICCRARHRRLVTRVWAMILAVAARSIRETMLAMMPAGEQS